MNHTFPQLALFSGAFLVRVLVRPITRRGIDAIHICHTRNVKVTVRVVRCETPGLY